MISQFVACHRLQAPACPQVTSAVVYQLRDQLVALVDLRDALAIDKDESSLSREDNPEACLVIIQYRTHLFGCIVDQVMGMQEIIVRSTPRLLEGCTVFSGHT